jgi:hypothetical protein
VALPRWPAAPPWWRWSPALDGEESAELKAVVVEVVGWGTGAPVPAVVVGKLVVNVVAGEFVAVGGAEGGPVGSLVAVLEPPVLVGGALAVVAVGPDDGGAGVGSDGGTLVGCDGVGGVGVVVG